MRNYGPEEKNKQKPRPWGQFCGPSRQFCHDHETIRIFLVLFFSLAFFEFFQILSKIIKLANTKFLSICTGRINVCLLLGRLLLNTFTRWDFMTMTDNIFYILLYVVVTHRNKWFGESNMLNDLIPDETAIKTSPIDLL